MPLSPSVMPFPMDGSENDRSSPRLSAASNKESKSWLLVGDPPSDISGWLADSRSSRFCRDLSRERLRKRRADFFRLLQTFLGLLEEEGESPSRTSTEDLERWSSATRAPGRRGGGYIRQYVKCRGLSRDPWGISFNRTLDCLFNNLFKRTIKAPQYWI